jgi:hypothetical protein
MVSTNGVIFPESMVDILANPVDIYFGLCQRNPPLQLLASSLRATRSLPTSRSKQIYRRKPTHPLLVT